MFPSLTYMKAVLYNAQATGDKYTEIMPISTEKLNNGSTRIKFKLPPHQSTTNDTESTRAQVVYIKVKVNDKNGSI